VIIDLAYLKNYFPDGQLITMNEKGYVSRAHQKIEYIHWLIEGSISFIMVLDERFPAVEVCEFAIEMFPIGWNGLELDSRNTKDIIVSSPQATFYRVPLNNEHTFLHTIKDFQLQQHVCKIQYNLLKEALFWQRKVLSRNEYVPKVAVLAPYKANEEPINSGELTLFFKKSPFFGLFDDETLAKLAQHACRKTYELKDVVCCQDSLSDGIYILGEGKLSLKRYEDKRTLSQWSVQNAGYVVGWSTYFGEPEFCTIEAVQSTKLYFVSWSSVFDLIEKDEKMKFIFYVRMNWLIDNYINAAFVRYLSFNFNYDELTIRYLIRQNQTLIHVSSELHKIPHLLRNKMTKSLAITILQDLLVRGQAKERRLASMCLELMKATIGEVNFLHQLQKVYTTVTDSLASKSELEIRKDCAIETQNLCNLFNFEVEGYTNLPESTGNIVIYNHLINDPAYTLNNNFQITLDSHFISAEILYRKYNDPGIRVVRIAQSQEFAHQNYYEKLGYINVATSHSAVSSLDKQDQMNELFFDEAIATLDKGYNLIISPEGTSYRTEDDIPGPFKIGAFKLALMKDPEPFIVPIILLNFDKKADGAPKYCKILPAFRISEHPSFNGVDNIKDFVRDYHIEFKGEVKKLKEQIKSSDNKKMYAD